MTRRRIAEDPPFYDDEERELIQEIEQRADAGLLVNDLTPERKEELEQWAHNTLEDQRQAVTADISCLDYALLGDRAKERGLTPEELLAEILHDYVEGRLVKA